MIIKKESKEEEEEKDEDDDEKHIHLKASIWPIIMIIFI
jgi:hypothetical protein